MTRIQLEAADDHVAALAHENDAVRAVLELIWNGLDADAHHIDVTLTRIESDGVVGVLVSDDGHGMTPESAATDFKWIGGSWKRAARKSQGEKRPLHGESGQGRLRAFALGTSARWETIATGPDGKNYKTVIRASASSRNDVELSEGTFTTELPGTSFEASGRQGLDVLESDQVRGRIASTFAPYLIANEAIELIYDGSRVDPAENIEADTTYDLTWECDATTYTATLRVIEWRAGKERAVHLCDANGVPVDELDSAPSPDFSYSAYICWESMPEHRNEWILARLEQQPTIVGVLVETAIQRLDDHFEERRSQKRRELVASWKEQQTYPYQGEADTEEAKLERATFDVVATSIRRHIPKTKKQQKLTLGLLRDSLQHRPGDVGELLDQFLGLPSADREQLDRLLKRTGLAHVIQATSSVANRLEFLRALELMVFDPEANNLVGEREHLHRILESELWVFGEQFNWMLSEKGLTTVLDRHLQELGEERAAKSPVKRLDGTGGRLDLLLSARANEHDRTRNLVIELKAPKVVATSKELAQIKSYAKAVVGDSQFANTSVVWDFWLITATMDEDVLQESNQRDRPRGLVFEPDMKTSPDIKVRVWVRTWSEVIKDARSRLDFFQQNLQHDPSLDDARDYLARNYADVIPEGLVKQSDEDGVVSET